MRQRPDFVRQSSEMPRDALSQTLELVDARTIYAGGFFGGGGWSIRFPPPRKIKFFVVGRGACRLALDGTEKPFDLEQGDVFLLTRNAGFTVASDLSLDSQPAHEIFTGARSPIVPVGEGDDFLFLGGHLDTDHAGGRLMMESLPDYLHLTAAESGTGRLGALIRELVEEAASRTPGADMACSSLAHLLLIQILRRHLSSGAVETGWLRAACDERLAPALALMHGEPSRNWSLVELARASAMSRTAFAQHFRAVAGLPPLTYLTEWRMRQAERALRKQGSSVANVAHAVGYGSEAAFSTAFKRVMGHSPRRSAEASRTTVDVAD
ncbi:AraC family transcriptional regulator [Mesorhizobium sp. BR1-1-16]|uniref:AraC family transcriptional regulator n=1 Tax=Mesorhizobium sp. BR1-1-16 TaxID=2876653 RepID=UPI001CCB9790|nr:AraC family transcriptional regulator [Mesorhizobium sp. BR1-1-16]MBZ9939198.1 AraC family transcriptional regulator [Mesorhizobium sp. BR1-1-16]